MYTLVSNRGQLLHGQKEFICDYESDIDTLPVNGSPGSTAFVIDGVKTFMLNHQKKWILVGGGNNTPAEDIFIVVNELPEVGQPKKIYLLRTSENGQNKYTEYLFIDGAWEVLGGNQENIDLDNIATQEDIAISVEDIDAIWGASIT